MRLISPTADRIFEQNNPVAKVYRSDSSRQNTDVRLTARDRERAAPLPRQYPVKLSCCPGRIGHLVEDSGRRNQRLQRRNQSDHCRSENLESHRTPFLVIVSASPGHVLGASRRDETRKDRPVRMSLGHLQHLRRDITHPPHVPRCLFREHPLHVDAQVDPVAIINGSPPSART